MSRILVAVLIVCIVSVNVFAKGNTKPKQAGSAKPKIYRRVIPADVLRDFPGLCFAATKCATVQPGESWELAPFCGRATCTKTEAPGSNGTFFLTETVEDCGPAPKPNPKCKLSDKTKADAAFPNCCPIYECEAGAKLEYPEVPAAIKQ